ncbi:MAG: hypothetical protein OXH03_00960, partial [Bacteroidetes bacterium]|nr:hypothetical protein [Bacteroidota bacterium]MDE2672733.1 hypothetical protein [Bacteroidota bacterium]
VEVGEVLESELSHGRVHFTSVCRNIRKLRLCKSEHPIVFTWDGQPIVVLQVGNGPQRIAVSEDGRDLYVAYWLPTPLIKRYSMPDLM